jgi:predicted TIM-barrel fold metal-dependent hydrolase
MEIIDFHTHIFPEQLAGAALAKLASAGVPHYGDGTDRGLISAMDQAGIAKSVVLPIATKSSHVEVINHLAAQEQAHFNSRRLLHWGTLYPKDLSKLGVQLAFLKEAKIPGIKLHPEYQDFYIDSPEVIEMFKAIAATGLLVLIHAGADPGPFTSDHARPIAIRRLLSQVPNLRLIAAHGGGWRMWDAVEQELLGLPVFLDTAALPGFIEADQALRLFRRHGIERILFASDWPWYPLPTCLHWLTSLGLKDSELEMILSKNAKGLLGLT